MIACTIYKGTPLCSHDFIPWVLGWYYRVSGMPVQHGRLPSGDEWLLIGSIIGSEPISDVLERLDATGPEVLFRADGQFLILISSKSDHSLYFYRDRTGVIPIAYAVGPKGIVVSTWPQDVIHLSGIRAISSDALLRHYPLYRVTILPDANVQHMKGLSGRQSLRICNDRLEVRDHPLSLLPDTPYRSLEESAADMGQALSEAVRKRIADCQSVGAWLSGGTDLSLLVALAREHFKGPLHTLFVTFEDYGRNYGQYARDVGERYACKHREFRFNAREYANAWADTISTIQEPINSPATISQWLALKQAHLHVDAMLIGEGADTVFGGPYWAPMLWLSYGGVIIPPFLRNLLRGASRTFQGEAFLVHALAKALRALGTPISEYLHSEIAFGESNSVDHVFGSRTWASTIEELQQRIPKPLLQNLISYLLLDWWPNHTVAFRRIGYHYGLIYVLPFIDYALIQKSFRLPMSLRYHYGSKKASLKRYALSYFNKDFINKPKEGFGVPLGKWFTTKEFAPFLGLPLEERSLKRGWWKEKELREVIEAHKSGRGTDSSAESVPWIAINLELWARIILENESPGLYRAS